MKRTMVIAEAGANHDRKFDQAIKLIDIAVKAKAEAVKFQTYSSETLYSKNTPDFAGYKNINKLIKDIELPREWQSDLKQYCDEVGIEFMSTPFDEQSVEELVELGVKRLKISGFESTDPRWVKYVASTKLPLIISLGIGTNLNTMEEIYEWIEEVSPNPDVTFLHCNNAYPTPHKDINLGQMINMRQHVGEKNIKIGLSDHTQGILTPPIAVSLGAQVIEKHYTLDRKLPGPDHPFAIEPNELIEMIKNIRLAENMLEVKTSEYTNSELNFLKARRSVIIKSNVKSGDIITENNITTKRPLLNDSIPAMEYYNVLGGKFKKELVADSILKWDNIEF